MCALPCPESKVDFRFVCVDLIVLHLAYDSILLEFWFDYSGTWMWPFSGFALMHPVPHNSLSLAGLPVCCENQCCPPHLPHLLRLWETIPSSSVASVLCHLASLNWASILQLCKPLFPVAVAECLRLGTLRQKTSCSGGFQFQRLDSDSVDGLLTVSHDVWHHHGGCTCVREPSQGGERKSGTGGARFALF